MRIPIEIFGEIQKYLRDAEDAYQLELVMNNERDCEVSRDAFLKKCLRVHNKRVWCKTLRESLYSPASPLLIRICGGKEVEDLINDIGSERVYDFTRIGCMETLDMTIFSLGLHRQNICSALESLEMTLEFCRDYYNDEENKRVLELNWYEQINFKRRCESVLKYATFINEILHVRRSGSSLKYRSYGPRFDPFE